MKRLIRWLLSGLMLAGMLCMAFEKEATAQALLDTPNWEVLGADVNWLSNSANETRGITVNPVTGHILVATRAGGNAIKVLDPDDGSVVSDLDLSGVVGGMFAINRLDATSDGQIFVGNFSLNGDGYAIYWYEDEDAAPVKVFEGNPYGGRIGDGFGVVETSEGIKVYASGTFNDRMAEFTWNPVEQELEDMRIITLPADEHANARILGVPGEDDALWINGRDATILKIDLDGNPLVEIGPNIVAPGNGELEFITANGRNFLVTGVRAPEDNVFSIIDITNEEAPFVIARTKDLTVNSNDFRVGDIAFDPGNSSVTFLVTNSGLTNFVLDFDKIVTDQLISSYYIPQGDFPRGFESLKEAFDSLNAVGANGPVTFYITDDLDESAHQLVLDNADVTEESPLLIKPLSGVQPVVTVSDTVGVEGGPAGITLFNTGWVTIDGSNEYNGDSRDLTILNTDGKPDRMISVLGASPNVTIKNTVIYASGGDVHTGVRSRRDGADIGVPTGLLVQNCQLGSAENPFVEGVQLLGTATNRNNAHIYDNEIYTSGRGITTWYNVDNRYIGNQIEIHNPVENRIYNSGIYLVLVDGETVIRENKITRLAMNSTDAPAYAASIVTNFNEGIITVANNLLGAGEAVNEGSVEDNNFYGIAINNAGSVAKMNVYHNTFRFMAGPEVGITAAVGFDGTDLDDNPIRNTAENYDFRNNIVHNETDNEDALAIQWYASAAQFSSDFNNLVVASEEANLVLLEGDHFETLAEWAAETDNDRRSASVPVEFAADDDWKLAGASDGDVRLAGTPIEGITTDIAGNPRSETSPYMGAYEGDVELVPEPDIRPFALEAPADGAALNLNDVDDNVVIEWEYPQSMIAWSQLNGRLEEDQFAHIGDGESGQGRYIGTQLGVAAWLQTPLLDNPGTLGFWVSTFSDDTVLDLVIEISEDGQTWDEVDVLEAREGGAGDISEAWSYQEVDIDSEGEYFVRFSQDENAIESFYLDDISVSSFLFPDELLLEEDFEIWNAFKSIKFTWHLDTPGSEFNNPELSLQSDRNGDGNTLTLTANQIDAALDGIGVGPGAVFTGSWTVTAELGDWVEFASEPFGISITRLGDTSAEAEQAYAFELSQNYPNPFNPATKIEFSLPDRMEVRLDVYTINGQRVATLVNETRQAGAHTVEFDGSAVSSGIYIYRIVAGDYVQTRKMTLIK